MKRSSGPFIHSPTYNLQLPNESNVPHQYYHRTRKVSNQHYKANISTLTTNDHVVHCTHSPTYNLKLPNEYIAPHQHHHHHKWTRKRFFRMPAWRQKRLQVSTFAKHHLPNPLSSIRNCVQAKPVSLYIIPFSKWKNWLVIHLQITTPNL